MTQPHEQQYPIDRILRELPLLRAPASLERRVLAEIERIEVRRRNIGFMNWPIGLRVACILVSFVAMLVSLKGSMWFGEQLTSHFAWLSAAGRSVSMFMEAVSYVSQGVSHWFYPFGIGLLAIYFVCVGVGATAYRTLFK